MIVYLNGVYMPAEQARISPFDQRVPFWRRRLRCHAILRRKTGCPAAAPRSDEQGPAEHRHRKSID